MFTVTVDEEADVGNRVKKEKERRGDEQVIGIEIIWKGRREDEQVTWLKKKKEKDEQKMNQNSNMNVIWTKH